jgi:CHAT domain-containing protein/tetratricopeptide (TPR) repeat protein
MFRSILRGCCCSMLALISTCLPVAASVRAYRGTIHVMRYSGGATFGLEAGKSFPIEMVLEDRGSGGHSSGFSILGKPILTNSTEGSARVSGCFRILGAMPGRFSGSSTSKLSVTYPSKAQPPVRGGCPRPYGDEGQVLSLEVGRDRITGTLRARCIPNVWEGLCNWEEALLDMRPAETSLESKVQKSLDATERMCRAVMPHPPKSDDRAMKELKEVAADFRSIADPFGEAEAMICLASLLEGQGEYSASFAMLDRAADLHQSNGNLVRAWGCRHALGEYEAQLGDYSLGLIQLEKANHLAEDAHMPEAQVESLHLLAVNWLNLGDPSKALDYERKMAAKSIELEDSVRRLSATCQIAQILAHAGRLQEAKEQLGEGLKQYKAFSEHIKLKYSYNSDSMFRKDYSEMASLSNDLGLTLAAVGLSALALPFHITANKCYVEQSDILNSALTMRMLGDARSLAGKKEQAALAYEESLKTFRYYKQFGREAQVLYNMGIVREELKDFTRAVECYEAALLIAERIGVKELEAMIAFNLAIVLPRVGREQACPPMFERSLHLFDQIREQSFPSLSESQRVGFMRKMADARFGMISMTVSLRGDNPSWRKACFNAWLRHKGAVLSAQAKLLNSVRAAKEPKVQQQLDAWRSLRLEAARMFMHPPQGLEADAVRKAQQDLNGRVTTAEVALSRLSPALAVVRDTERVDCDRIAQALQPGTTYVDFALVRGFDFEKRARGETRCFAFVLHSGKGSIPALVDLGPAEPILAAVKALRATLHQDPKPHQKALYRLTIQILEPMLQSSPRLVISPDGPLNLVPFEIFRDTKETLLRDRFQIEYVTSGQDFGRTKTETVASRRPVLMANPDFDLKLPGESTKPSGSALNLVFDSLPGTGSEADAIALILNGEGPLNLQGPQALEMTLLDLESPRVLHLATHGYFLGPESVGDGDDPLALFRGVSLEGLPKPPAPREGVPKLDNPLVRSGIVLSGANTALKLGRDDGMVSAEKILGMRLEGTELVTLSACETGLGQTEDGEGVFGLKRAFLLAGARQLIVSLWQVPDLETKDLMTDFYRRWATGTPLGQALNEAKRAMATKKPAPYYWAAFVLVGVPNLSGNVKALETGASKL